MTQDHNARHARNALFLQEMGIGPLWLERLPHTGDADMTEGMEQPNQSSAGESLQGIQPPFPESRVENEMSTPAVSEMNWVQLKAAVAACRQCGLCEKRTNTVFGVGDEQAKWLFVGEGPGRNEDKQGEPFVGPAGKLLDNMLLALGLRRGANAYIANIVKCRPTDASGKDRPPDAAESGACMPFLDRQIALIQPRVIVALGKTAALSLLKLDPDTPVARLRGKVHRYGDLPLIVTYHPAYLLRNLPDKRKSWDDLCLAMSTYAGTAA